MTKFDIPEKAKANDDSQLEQKPLVDLAQRTDVNPSLNQHNIERGAKVTADAISFADRKQFDAFPVEQSIATTPSMRLDSDWMPQHDSYASSAKKGGVDTLFLGDSITWGMKPEILQDKFGSGALNFGIPGDRTQNLLWRMQHGELNFPQNDQPKVAVMLIGTNNFSDFDSVPPSTNNEIVNGIKANLNELRKGLPDTKILVVGILPRGETLADPLRVRIDQINSELSAIADNKHIFFGNIGKDLVQADGSIAPDVMADFLHPTHDKGNSLMLEAIRKNVDRVNKTTL